MPVLVQSPQTTSPAEALDQGARMYSGLLTRTRQKQQEEQALKRQQQDDEWTQFTRNLERPVAQEKIKLGMAKLAGDVKTQEYALKRQQQAIASELEAQQRYQWIESQRFDPQTGTNEDGNNKRDLLSS